MEDGITLSFEHLGDGRRTNHIMVDEDRSIGKLIEYEDGRVRVELENRIAEFKSHRQFTEYMLTMWLKKEELL